MNATSNVTKKKIDIALKIKSVFVKVSDVNKLLFKHNC